MEECKICKKQYNNKGAYKKHILGCFDNEFKDIIVKEYNNGLSLNDIIKKYNIGKTAIRNVLVEKIGKLRTNKEAYKSGFISHDEETKSRISNSMKGNRNANHRGDRQSYYNGIRMDSSWEVKVAKYLDDNNYNWKYDSEKFLLSDGRYIHPDFFIYDDNDNLIKIIEVKGYFRDANKLKFQMFLNEYSNLNIELWDKTVLKNKNILG